MKLVSKSIDKAFSLKRFAKRIHVVECKIEIYITHYMNIPIVYIFEIIIENLVN